MIAHIIRRSELVNFLMEGTTEVHSGRQRL